MLILFQQAVYRLDEIRIDVKECRVEVLVKECGILIVEMRTLELSFQFLESVFHGESVQRFALCLVLVDEVAAESEESAQVLLLDFVTLLQLLVGALELIDGVVELVIDKLPALAQAAVAAVEQGGADDSRYKHQCQDAQCNEEVAHVALVLLLLVLIGLDDARYQLRRLHVAQSRAIEIGIGNADVDVAVGSVDVALVEEQVGELPVCGRRCDSL